MGPACSVPKTRLGWESVSAILPMAEYQNRKIFFSFTLLNNLLRKLKSKGFYLTG